MIEASDQDADEFNPFLIPEVSKLRFRTREQVEELVHLLTNPVLRDNYDKTGNIMKRKEFEEERKGNIP